MASLETCPGCGLSLPRGETAAGHAYIGASPSCWERYGELLAREYGEPAYFGVHQLTVDTYAVQHPGRRERRSIQSVGLHLMTLGLVVEQGVDPAMGPAIHRRTVRRVDFEWLEPPSFDGCLTVLHPLAATRPDDHRAAVEAWGRDVWDAWSRHHATVRVWLEEAGLSRP